MRKLTFLLVTGISMLAMLAWAGQGHQHGCKHGKHGHHGHAMMKEGLKQAGLSDQQIRRIEVLHDEMKKQKLDIRHQIEKLQLEKQTMMKNYQVDKAELFALVEKMHALKLEKKKKWLEFRLNMRKEMTPAQFEKVRELHAKKKGKHHKKGDCGCGGKGKGHHHK